LRIMSWYRVVSQFDKVFFGLKYLRFLSKLNPILLENQIHG
jgi:hypothetical protein